MCKETHRNAPIAISNESGLSPEKLVSGFREGKWGKMKFRELHNYGVIGVIGVIGVTHIYNILILLCFYPVFSLTPFDFVGVKGVIEGWA
ncbi:hypothetical protein M2305_001281 [Gluconobacter cerinus]|nr:hypothetical protein [Gluconobacter cerinus]